MARTIGVFVTGDGYCPWCGKIIHANRPSTHHVHQIDSPGPKKAAFIRSLKNNPV